MDQDELNFMKRAIEIAKKDPRPYFKIGTVIVTKDGEVKEAHGERISKGDHAEYTLLERKLIDKDVTGATLYTTLEPCTKTYHPTNPRKTCAQIISDRRIGRVVIGMLDPNPDIKGKGVNCLKEHNVQVNFFSDFSEELTRECEGLLDPSWVQLQRTRRQVKYENLFSLLEKYRNAQIFQYPRFTVDNALTLRLCPDIRRGWLMSKVELRHDTTKFPLPSEYMELYKKYSNKSYDEKGFKTDNPKIMLYRHPRSFTDAPPLTLHTRETVYSHTQFYKDVVIADDPTKREALIQKFVIGEERVAEFPHCLCLHIVVITNNGKVLIAKRAPDVEYYPNTWSCSIEENMKLEDLEGGIEGTVLRWGKRSLKEELGLTEGTDYSVDNLRILSVFLESEILNVSLCGHVVLNISSGRLERILRGVPREDEEFTGFKFLEYEDGNLIAEILGPTLPYHPTSRYRMIMALMKKNGMPTGAGKFFQ